MSAPSVTETDPARGARGASGGAAGGGAAGGTAARSERERELPHIDPDAYELLDELARGGMGRIWRARDRLGRIVAVKQLLDPSPQTIALFEREARITARLQHPSIVSVIEAGILPNGERMYAMKLVPGRALRDVLREPLGVRERLGLLPIAISIADALAYAHQEGVIHRDLKPSNVLIGEFGEVVVIDWGLAHDARGGGEADDGGDEVPADVTARAMGTPAYMAPEAARGEPADERADVYAIGAILYETLAGAPPYRGEDGAAILAAVRAGPPEPIARRAPGTPADLAAMAASEGATSKLAAIELAGREPPPLELVLEHGAEIAGVVVTAAGEPVAEARVRADPAGAVREHGELEDRLRGAATAIAGTDGRFRIAGLPPGTYLVRAIRPGSSSHLLHARLGVAIQTGAEARIVVDDLSAIAGRVAYEGGKPVTRFAVQLGTAPPRWFASADGAFRVDEVPAGRQFVRITGPDVVAHALHEVMVEARRTTDLGTITVQEGRTIAGSVIDRGGRPVAGAAVVIAHEIRGDGTSLVPYARPGTIEVVTGADGRFAARGVGPDKYEISADHEAAGRSQMVAIPPGTTDVELALTLQPPGVVQGFVRMNGRPAEAIVVLRATTAADSRITVRTGLDGSYRIDRVAPGRYMHITVRDHLSGNEASTGRTQAIEVTAGGVVTHDVDLTPSGIAVILRLTSPGDVVKFGYGFVGSSDDERLKTMPLPKTISEARAASSQIQSFELREGMIVDRGQLKLEKVRPGFVLACASPLRGDPKDPAIVAEMQQRLTEWPVYCKRLVLPGAPDPQQITVEVQPLPPPK